MNGFEVVTVGEVLVEVATSADLAQGLPAVVGLSGDCLNAAIAASRAGARTALAAVLPEDDLGVAMAEQIAGLGISTDLLRFRPGQQGMYLVRSDPQGSREFSYARAGSVGSTLSPQDLDPDAVAAAEVVLASGVTAGISASGASTVRRVAHLAKRFVFDPNFRPRLTTASALREVMEEVAQLAYLMTPSHPSETGQLLGENDPAAAAARVLAMGSAHVAVTCGEQGVLLDGPDGALQVDAVPAPRLVDQTGAGDVFVGTLCARVALGDTIGSAARTAVAAASLAVGGRGGAGLIPTLQETLRHAGLPVTAGPGDAGARSR